MSEETLKPVLDIFENFDKLVEKLEDIPKQATKKTDALLDVFFEQKDIFEDPKIFLSALNDLSEEIGHAYHTVLSIELARQRINPQKIDEIAQFFTRPKTNGRPIIVQPSAPSNLSWLATYFYSKAVRDAAKATVKGNTPEGTPQISTSQEVIDILEFGRQLIPEFNRVQEYFQQCIDHLYFFKDPDTKERFHSELRKHMNKLAGIIRAFTRTIAEYRKEIVGESKRDIAKSIIALQIAEKQSMGEWNLKDIYRALREKRGPTEF